MQLGPMKSYAADVVSGQHWLYWLLGARRDFAMLRPKVSQIRQGVVEREDRRKMRRKAPRSHAKKKHHRRETVHRSSCSSAKISQCSRSAWLCLKHPSHFFYSTFPTPPLRHQAHTGDQQKHKSFINNKTCFSVPRIRPNGQPHAGFESTMQE